MPLKLFSFDARKNAVVSANDRPRLLEHEVKFYPVLSENSDGTISRGFSKIIPQQTTESCSATERAFGGKLVKFGSDYFVFQPLLLVVA